MAKKRKNFIREKRIYCGEEYLEVDIVAVTNMPEAGKGKKGKSSQAQKNLNDKRSKRRFVQIANTNFGTNDFHISATYNNEHLPMSLEEAEKNVHNYLDRIKRKEEGNRRGFKVYACYRIHPGRGRGAAYITGD